jgi:hypothetical protein
MAKVVFTSIAVVLTAICLSGSAWALGSTPVTVVNPADIAKAEGIQTPFQAHGVCTFSPGVCSGVIDVPPSQRLVIEFVSAFCIVGGNNVISNGTLATSTGGSFVDHYLIASAPISNLGGTQGIVTVSQLVRIYTDAGSGGSAGGGIGFSFESSGNNQGNTCDFAVSGQLVAVP